MFISRQSHSHVLNINDRGSWYGTNAFSGRLNSTSYRDATVYNDCSIPYSSPVLRDTSQCLFKLTPQCTAFSYVVRGVSEPHTSELNGGFFIYILLYYYIISVICIPYVSLDCNLTQPHTGVRGQDVPPCRMSPRTFCIRAHCPPGHCALVRNVPPQCRMSPRLRYVCAWLQWEHVTFCTGRSYQGWIPCNF